MGLQSSSTCFIPGSRRPGFSLPPPKFSHTVPYCLPDKSLLPHPPERTLLSDGYIRGPYLRLYLCHYPPSSRRKGRGVIPVYVGGLQTYDARFLIPTGKQVFAPAEKPGIVVTCSVQDPDRRATPSSIIRYSLPPCLTKWSQYRGFVAFRCIFVPAVLQDPQIAVGLWSGCMNGGRSQARAIEFDPVRRGLANS